MRTASHLLHRSRRRSQSTEVPVTVRSIRAADAPLLVDGFNRLSDESRRLRFLGGKAALTPAEVRYFTEVDHHDHEAVVALDGFGRGVGVARYVRNRQLRDTAEVAIVVVDDWQRRGIGTKLLSRLADRAADEDVRCFTALIADDNVAVLGLLRSLGARIAVTGAEFGSVRLAIPVASLLAEARHADDLVASSCCAAD